MSDPVSLYRERKGEIVYVAPYRREGRNSTFYVNIWHEGKRTTKSIDALAVATFPEEYAYPDSPPIKLAEFPKYLFFCEGDDVQVFKNAYRLRFRRHPRGRQDYVTLVDYAGKRTTISSGALKIMCADEQCLGEEDGHAG
jgi:hypothetical protein